MTFAKLIRMAAFLVVGAAFILSGAFAQEPQDQPPPQDNNDTQPGSKPKPAARGVPAMSDPNSTVENDQPPTNWNPDNGPTTGFQDATLGSPELAHSYWVPGFIVGSTIQSRPPGELANNGWYANNYVGGQLSLLQSSGRSQFGLNVSGGGYFTTDSQQNDGGFAQLSSGYTINLNRWQVQMFDYFSFIPESQFGFASGTGLALPGVSGSLGPAIPGLGMSVIPNQSIYSAIGPRYSNAFAAQITYMLSRRASITMGGSFGILRFTEPGNVNNDMALGSFGFNYALNPHDSIGVLYRFSGFHYEGEPQALGSHTVNFVYQKKVAQKMALTLFGGPQFTYFRVPVNGQTSNTGVSAGGQFTYGFQRANIALSYFHGITAGSGALLGSTTDEATVSLQKRFGRVWSGRINTGFSRNESLTTLPGVPSQTYKDWFAGGSVSRPFGRNAQFSASYEATFENTNQPVCSGTDCSSSFIINVITLTFEMHTRPLVF